MAQHITVGGLGATVVGTAAHVADEFERWVEEADVDGFNIVRLQTNLDLRAKAHSPDNGADIDTLARPMRLTQDHLKK